MSLCNNAENQKGTEMVLKSFEDDLVVDAKCLKCLKNILNCQQDTQRIPKEFARNVMDIICCMVFSFQLVTKVSKCKNAENWKENSSPARLLTCD